MRDLIQHKEVKSEFYIEKNELNKWTYIKCQKKEMWKNAQGFEDNYSEDGMTLSFGLTVKVELSLSIFSSLPKKGILFLSLTQKL